MEQRAAARIFALLLVGSLIPYLWLAHFAHPLADDYCYAAKSAGQTYWEWSKGEWWHWNGRYTSNLLMINGPLTWSADHLRGYRAMPIALLALTFLSAWFLLARATRHTLGRSREVIAALAFLLLYLVLMPDPGEGFYWYTGAITYQLGSILLLLHLGLLFPREPGTRNTPWLLLNLILAVAIVGMDEVHMLMMVCFHFARTAWLLRQRRSFIPALLLLAAVWGGAALMFLAPGNQVRGDMFADTHRLGYSLGMSAIQSLRFVGKWLLNPSLIVLLLLYSTLHRRLAVSIAGYRRLLHATPPWLAAALPFLLVMATTFPAYWSTGLLGQHRTINVACLFAIPLLFFNLAMWLERRGRQRVQEEQAAPTRSARLMAWTMVLAIVALNTTGNGYDAWADLLGGRAAAYSQVQDGREAAIQLAALDPGKTIVYERMVQPPRILPSYEVRGPLTPWMLHCQARFFGAEESQVAPIRP